jgi:hypothetical protein
MQCSLADRKQNLGESYNLQLYTSSLETLTDIYQTTRRHTLDDTNLQGHLALHGCIKSHKYISK